MEYISNSISSTTLFKIRKSFIKLDNVTKVELSNKVGISFPTISKFLDQMESNGEALLVGLDKSSGGRKAKRYRYNPDYMLGLAIFLEQKETQYTVFIRRYLFLVSYVKLILIPLEDDDNFALPSLCCLSALLYFSIKS